MRSAGGTRSADPGLETRSTNATIAFLGAVSFQDGRGSATVAARSPEHPANKARVKASVTPRSRPITCPSVRQRQSHAHAQAVGSVRALVADDVDPVGDDRAVAEQVSLNAPGALHGELRDLLRGDGHGAAQAILHRCESRRLRGDD